MERILCNDVIDYRKVAVVATIKQVAERAGVSSATVSRVLNDDRQVSSACRDQVLRAVAELDYRPNRLARSLRRRQTETIGVIISDIENPHFTRAVRVIEDAAYNASYRVILCNTDETAEKQRAYLEVLAAEQVVGVILAPADPGDSTIAALIDMDIPIVAFDRRVDDQRADAVLADNIHAARVATEHLFEAGRSNIGFISGRNEIQSGIDRLTGYTEAMQVRQCPVAIANGAFRLDAAQTATAALLADHPELDGLVIANNLMAIGTLRALREMGKRVPDDIALVSIDDPPWAGLVEPPMTTLRQPIHQMAQSAFEMLVTRITAQRTHSRFVIYNFELVLRQSCGFPDARKSPEGVASLDRVTA